MRVSSTFRVLASALLYLGATSCSDDTSSGETTVAPAVTSASASAATASETTPQATSAATTTPSAPTTSRVSTPTPTTSLAPAGSVTDEIDIVPSPDWLEVDERGVWAKLDEGSVYLVDPGTNEVSAEIETGGDLCQGLGVGDGSVWSCAGPDVVRIDPATNKVVATISLGKTYTQGELAVSEGKVWVLTGDGSSLVPIDAATDTPGTPIMLPSRGTDLGAGPSGIWVVSSLDNVVMHVDPSTGAVLSTTDVSAPADVAVDGDEVWVVGSAETVRIDASSGAVTLTVPVGGGKEGGIALTESTVWLRSVKTFVTRIDRAAGEVIDDDKTAVYADIAARLTSGGDIVAGFGSIWTSAYDDGKLFRISAGEADASS